MEATKFGSAESGLARSFLYLNLFGDIKMIVNEWELPTHDKLFKKNNLSY